MLTIAKGIKRAIPYWSLPVQWTFTTLYPTLLMLTIAKDMSRAIPDVYQYSGRLPHYIPLYSCSPLPKTLAVLYLTDVHYYHVCLSHYSLLYSSSPLSKALSMLCAIPYWCLPVRYNGHLPHSTDANHCQRHEPYYTWCLPVQWTFTALYHTLLKVTIAKDFNRAIPYWCALLQCVFVTLYSPFYSCLPLSNALSVLYLIDVYQYNTMDVCHTISHSIDARHCQRHELCYLLRVQWALTTLKPTHSTHAHHSQRH